MPEPEPTVSEILSRTGSGYGREQLLLVALRLASADHLRWFGLEGGTPDRTVEDVAADYLRLAEQSLKGEPDA